MPAKSVKAPLATVIVKEPFAAPLVAVAVQVIESVVVRFDKRARPGSFTVMSDKLKLVTASEKVKVTVVVAPLVLERFGAEVELSVGGVVSAAVTVMLAVSVAAEYAVVPPFVVVVTLVPAVPLVWSQARNVMFWVPAVVDW